MKILAADAYLAEVWPTVWPLLEPAIRRAPDKPDVLAKLRSHDAQLWAVCEAGKPIAACITVVQDLTEGRILLFWMLGGSRAREWLAQLADTVEVWARSLNCVAMRASGRRGWARLADKIGFKRIDDAYGLPVWQRKVENAGW